MSKGTLDAAYSLFAAVGTNQRLIFNFLNAYDTEIAS